jgi:GH15 family glucan-1,4-alpha-glucosidase
VWTSDLLSGEYTWQAVSFVQSQADEELWEELINQSMHNPAMVWSTLRH